MLGNSSNLFDESIVQLVKRIAPVKVLELGCGTGKFSTLLGNNAIRPEITAVQKLFSHHNLDTLKAAGYADVIDSDILEYYKKGFDEKYDLIAILDVIEHFLLSDALSIIDFSLYRAQWLLLVWPSKHPQDAVSNAFDRHRTSFEIETLSKNFDLVHYEQKGFAQMHFLNRYHCCLLRGHMNVLNLNPM
jgi:SAM-dependent methyltransferase